MANVGHAITPSNFEILPSKWLAAAQVWYLCQLIVFVCERHLGQQSQLKFFILFESEALALGSDQISPPGSSRIGMFFEIHQRVGVVDTSIQKVDLLETE